MKEKIFSSLICDVSEVKTEGEKESRVLRFLGSTEDVDRSKEIIKVDGWDLTSYKKNPVFLWAHQYYAPPIGKAVKVQKTEKGLEFDIQFATVEENPFADQIFRLYKGGYMRATSVGFIPKQWQDGDPEEDNSKRVRRTYIKQELLELSSVPVPANPAALMMAVKENVITEDERKAFVSSVVKMISEDAPEFLKEIVAEIQKAEVPEIEVPEELKETLIPSVFNTPVITGIEEIQASSKTESQEDDNLEEIEDEKMLKALQERMRLMEEQLAEVKAGRTLSKKTRDRITKAVEAMDGVKAELLELLKADTESTSEDSDKDKDKDKTAEIEITEDDLADMLVCSMQLGMEESYVNSLLEMAGASGSK